jgi:hypothetical protein
MMAKHVDETKPVAADLLSVPDQYGHLHPIETPDLVRSKLKDLEVEIAKLDKEVKEAYHEAQTKCPDLITDEFKLIFLRCELFNAEVSTLYSWHDLLCREKLNFYFSLLYAVGSPSFNKLLGGTDTAFRA